MRARPFWFVAALAWLGHIVVDEGFENGQMLFSPAFSRRHPDVGVPYWGSSVRLRRGAADIPTFRRAVEALVPDEAIAFQSADVLAAMEKDAGITLTELRVDGGATANDLLLQFQADILGVPVVRSRVRETTARGAAYLAGLAVGYWTSDADITSHWQADRHFEPAMPRERVASLRAGWERAVSRAMAWAQP